MTISTSSSEFISLFTTLVPALIVAIGSLIAAYLTHRLRSQKPISSLEVLDVLYAVFVGREPKRDYLGRFLKLDSNYVRFLAIVIIFSLSIGVYYLKIQIGADASLILLLYIIVDNVTRKKVRGGKSRDVFLPRILKPNDYGRLTLRLKYIVYSSAFFKVLFMASVIGAEMILLLDLTIGLYFTRYFTSTFETYFGMLFATYLILALFSIFTGAFQELRWATHTNITKEVLKQAKVRVRVYFTSKGDTKGDYLDGEVVSVVPNFMIKYYNSTGEKEGDNTLFYERIRFSHINRIAFSIEHNPISSKNTQQWF